MVIQLTDIDWEEGYFIQWIIYASHTILSPTTYFCFHDIKRTMKLSWHWHRLVHCHIVTFSETVSVMSDDTKGVVNLWDWIRIEYNEIEPPGGVSFEWTKCRHLPKMFRKNQRKKVQANSLPLSFSVLLSVREMWLMMHKKYCHTKMKGQRQLWHYDCAVCEHAHITGFEFQHKI